MIKTIVVLGLCFLCACSGDSSERSARDAGVLDGNVPDARGSSALDGQALDAARVDDAALSQDAAELDPPRAIRDGSKSIRLYYAAFAPERRAPPGTAGIFTANGTFYLIIDGACRYWASGDPMLQSTVTGVLSSEEAEALGEDLRYAAWPRLAGEYADDDVMFDVDTLQLRDGQHELSCLGGCREIAAIGSIFEHAHLAYQRLRDEGSAVEGPMRVSAVHESINEPWLATMEPIEWPLEAPFDDYALDPQADPFTNVVPRNYGVIVEDPGDLATLRALRKTYRAQGKIWRSYGFIPVNAPRLDGMPGLVGYKLYFRDVIPLEDDDGLIALDVETP